LRVCVRLYGWLKDYFKVGTLTLELDYGSYQELVSKLAKNLNDKDGLLVEGGRLREEEVIVALNGEVVSLKELNRIKFKDGDIIDVMPLPSGG